MSTYRVIVFDPITGQLTEKHIRREWRAIANELGCDYIEHAQRFGLDFWCDEEGLLKDNPPLLRY